MQITITKTFDSPEQAAEFLARISKPMVTFTVDPPSAAAVNIDTPVAGETKARKPRSDAGQPRGNYKPRNAATPESSAPKQEEPKSAAEGQHVPPAPATVAEDFPATLEGCRAVLKKMNDTPGKGMDACIAALKAHGVNRISDLKAENYAAFVQYVLGQLPAAK